MAKATNGHDPIQQKMLDVLLSIDKRLANVEVRLENVEVEIRGMKTEVRKLGDRIDNILTGEFGKTVRDYGERILRLEGELSEIRHKMTN